MCFVLNCVAAVRTVRYKGCIESVAGPIEKQEKQNTQILAEEEGSAGGGMRCSKLHI